jgi:hypothetical protein
MATPPYKGAGQPPTADDSFWSGLGSWFGGGTPAYKPAPATNVNTSANTSTSKNANTTVDPAAIARAIDPSSLPVVVLVPRSASAQCDVSDPQDDESQR